MNYQHITSLTNNKIKQIVKLANSRAYRYEQSLAVVYGRHLVEEALAANVLNSVFIDQGHIRDYQELIKIVSEETIYSVSQEVLNKVNITESEVDIIGIVKIQTGRLIESTYKSDCVILEGVQDPGNLGTIFRACAASGINNIVLSNNCVDPYSIKVLRASQGIQFKLNIINQVDIQQFITKYEYDVLATAPIAGETIYQHDLTVPCAWLFGNEGSGLSKEVLNNVKCKLSIPMYSTTESLNVAMAATVCLFEMQRQRIYIRDVH